MLADTNTLSYPLVHGPMQKSYFGVTITITIVFAIIIYPLLPILAHGQQQLFPFSYPTTTTNTTTTKDQINNNIQNKSTTTSYSFSADSKKGENTNNDNNDNNSNNIEPASGSSSSTNKVVILNFYDNAIGQLTNAKSILDEYGFKGTFFIVCKWASSDNPDRMTWQDINQLYREGHDIESHSTSHKVLNKLSADALDYEVGQSKQCLYDHLGIYPQYFLLHTVKDGITQL